MRVNGGGTHPTRGRDSRGVDRWHEGGAEEHALQRLQGVAGRSLRAVET